MEIKLFSAGYTQFAIELNAKMSSAQEFTHQNCTTANKRLTCFLFLIYDKSDQHP